MKRYYIEVYDPDVKKWEDQFAFDPEGIFTKEDAEETIRCLREVDYWNNESHVYRIKEIRK